MKYRIAGEFYPLLEFLLDKGEFVYAEPGAMVFHSPCITINTKLHGFSDAIKRVFFGKENPFINSFISNENGGYLGLAPSFPGAICDIELSDPYIKVRPGYFLAAYGDNISISGNFSDFSSYFAFEESSFLTVKGYGLVFICGLGVIRQLDVEDHFIVDTNHIVAYESTLSINLKPEGGVKSFFFSKEGLVCKVEGKGRLWIQSINPELFSQFFINSALKKT